MKPNDLVRLTDATSVQRYRTRYWKQRRQIPKHLPRLDATYKVVMAWPEILHGQYTDVASIRQVQPAMGRGMTFIIPQALLTPVQIAEQQEPDAQP